MTAWHVNCQDAFCFGNGFYSKPERAVSICMAATSDLMHARDPCCLVFADCKRQTQYAATRGPKNYEPMLPGLHCR